MGRKMTHSLDALAIALRTGTPSQSGSDGALLRRRPLRTGLAGFPRTRLKQALKAVGRRYRSGANVVGEAALAPGVDQTECGGLVRCTGTRFGGDRLFADRRAGHCGPLFPRVGSLWFAVGVQQ